MSLRAIAKMATMLRCKVWFGRSPVTYIHSCNDPMVATLPTPPTESIHLSGISWQTYETLLQELSDRRLRLTYNRGNLEIIAPTPEHERFKKVSGRFVETMAEELDIRIEPLG